MYDKKRKESEKKKQQKAKAQKELKFWYNIGEHDLDIKLKKAQDFLNKWHAVKLMVVLRWREKAYKELVREKFTHIQEVLAEYGKSQWVKEEQFGFLLLMIPKRR
jgi:translation initiation factor IF-3